MNTVFDDTDGYLSPELKAIIYHKSSNGVLYFKVEYTNGDVQCYSTDLVKDKDPYTAAIYIITNNLGITRNMTEGRWACLFLRSLKITLRRLRRSDSLGFDVSTFNLSLTSKQRWYHRYAKKWSFCGHITQDTCSQKEEDIEVWA